MLSQPDGCNWSADKLVVCLHLARIFSSILSATIDASSVSARALARALCNGSASSRAHQPAGASPVSSASRPKSTQVAANLRRVEMEI